MTTKLETYYGLPTKVKFCKKCTISNQRPNSVVEFKNKTDIKKPTIEFDDKGICSACTFSEIKESKINWQERENELTELCSKYRSKDGRYDCIIPGSGGKDSSYVSHILKYKYNMNPLTVTWSPHIYTDIGFKNFNSWIDSGFDNILFSPNGKLHRLLTKLAFENLVHPFQPFIIGQKIIASKFSALYGIPLVFYGENQAEYGNNIVENDSPTMDSKFFTSTRNLSELYLGGISANELIEDYKFSKNDLNPYLPVCPSNLEKTGTEVHYMSYYIKWDPQEFYYYVAENTNYQVNTERTEGTYSKYSSIDDKMDVLHYYTTLIKFGLGRATYDSCQEIRNDKITREEGILLVKQFDSEFPKKYFKEILEYLDISEDRFWEVINNARSPHLWKKENGEWCLRNIIS